MKSKIRKVALMSLGFPIFVTLTDILTGKEIPIRSYITHFIIGYLLFFCIFYFLKIKDEKKGSILSMKLEKVALISLVYPIFITILNILSKREMLIYLYIGYFIIAYLSCFLFFYFFWRKYNKKNN